MHENITTTKRRPAEHNGNLSMTKNFVLTSVYVLRPSLQTLGVGLKKISWGREGSLRHIRRHKMKYNFC